MTPLPAYHEEGHLPLVHHQFLHQQVQVKNRKENDYFSFFNYRKSQFFVPQLQNRLSSLSQLSKSFVLPPSAILQAVL